MASEQVTNLTIKEAHLLDSWNNTARSYDLTHCLHERIVAQARLTPDAIAVKFGSTEVSYAELDRRSDRLASRLRALGVRADVLVGVVAHRSIEMVVALLGTLKAGGAYVPFDPTYPADRLEYMISDTGSPVLLVQSDYVSLLPAYDGHLVLLDDESGVTDTSTPAVDATSETGPHNLAYLIYTSGSTGRPKGVMIEHAAICNRLIWMQEQYGLTADDVILQKTPYSFDVSVWEFFWPLLYGATLVMAEPDGHRDPRYLASAIETNGVTTMHFVPSMLSVFLDNADMRKCGSLKRVFTSGEALPLATMKRFFELCREAGIEVELHNLYGPTEAAVDVTYWPCSPDASLVPIGKPVANTQLYIVNEGGARVGIGETGELLLGGHQIARGYLNRAELTAEKFIPNPFHPDLSPTLYRTGDLARFLPDGNVEYQGRIDFQVKLRGNRIELGEIESVLEEDASVRQAVVVLDESLGEPRLVAYLASARDSTIQLPDLRRKLKLRLPDYMVPTAYVTLDELPLSPNGKVDRRALPAPDSLRQDQDVDFVAPQTPDEEILADICRSLLQVDQVGVLDNLFEIGVTSFMVAQICAQAEERGIVLDPRSFFDNHSISALLADRRKTTETRNGSEKPGKQNQALPESVVVMQGKGTKSPVFFVGVFHFQTLANLIGPDRPSYGLLGRNMDADGKYLDRVEEMAALYVDDVIAAYPDGPYNICGFCFGAVVAFELARQLTERGKTVTSLTLINGFIPALRPETDAADSTEGEADTDDGIVERLSGRLAFEYRKRRRQSHRLIGTAYQKLNLEIPGRFIGAFTMQNDDKLLANYIPKVYTGNVAYLRCEGWYDGVDPVIGWSSLIEGDLEIIDVPGNHTEALNKPHVIEIATVYSNVLDAADVTDGSR